MTTSSPSSLYKNSSPSLPLVYVFLPHYYSVTLHRSLYAQKAFYSFAFDEVYWRKLVTSTFRLPAQPLRENGWRDLYKNLPKATLFTWGSNDKGRLGHDDHILRVPFPLDVDLQPNQVAVDVVMGYSFYYYTFMGI